MTIKPAYVWIGIELIGITLVCLGAAHWSVAAAFVVGGMALVAEAAKLS